MPTPHSDLEATTRDGIRLGGTLYNTEAMAPARVVLVHSLAMDRTFWRPVAERLATQAAILTYGFAPSSPSPCGTIVARTN